jgi:hypothetical protein
VRRSERPNFDQIVARLQGEIGDEVRRKEEPQIVLYSLEKDSVYHERIGKEDEIEDSDGEDDLATSRKKAATMRKAHEEAMARVMRELEESRTREAALLERLSRAERN